jgi:hypothetical protein
VSQTLSEWELKVLALEQLFRDLPIRRDANTAGIPYDYLIRDIPRQLLLMRPTPRVRIIVTKKGLRSKPESTQPAKQALRRLAQSVRRTINAIDDLSPAARDRLNLAGVPRRQFATALNGVQIKLQALRIDADAAASAVKAGARPTLERPTQAQKIAGVVAQHYFGLTGKRATRSNRAFIELLQRVYEALGIKAKAEAQAADLTRRNTHQT